MREEAKTKKEGKNVNKAKALKCERVKVGTLRRRKENMDKQDESKQINTKRR